MPEGLTVKEAAAAKGVAPSTIARAIAEGRLPATPYTPPGSVKGSWRIDAAALEAWTPLTDPGDRGRRSGEARRAKGPKTRP